MTELLHINTSRGAFRVEVRLDDPMPVVFISIPGMAFATREPVSEIDVLMVLLAERALEVTGIAVPSRDIVRIHQYPFAGPAWEWAVTWATEP